MCINAKVRYSVVLTVNIHNLRLPSQIKVCQSDEIFLKKHYLMNTPTIVWFQKFRLVMTVLPQASDHRGVQ